MENSTKKYPLAGADERTPSRAQYFSWINNTNEGSTEEHTLINLEYFKYLRDTYGMQLDIYAWDAGNLDGSRGTYQTLDSDKIRAQYPNGYGKCAEACEKIGAKMGIWCGPDGFGDTEESEAARRELMISLCRDYHFELFKMDRVCGTLREEKQKAFADMMTECRKYSPELILLNHRLELGSARPYATTFLWNGEETYTDVLINSVKCAPHHREYTFHRGNVPGLKRLTEDHGVCLSSCLDYFEDELIYQAFGRCMILAPEIYANPWFLRDDEQAKLARIYNLHRTYRDILVDGMELPVNYGPFAVARGSDRVRFITTGNDTWNTVNVRINLNAEIGLSRFDGEIVVSCHHPYERFVGKFRYGDRVEIPVLPFRSALIEVAYANEAYPMLTGCEYEVLHETNGVPDKVNILKVFGKIDRIVNGEVLKAPDSLLNTEYFDSTVSAPIEIEAVFERADIPENIETLYEGTLFGADNDSAERRCINRSGESKIPEVNAAREAFFNQKTYKLRGCESSFAFDGKSDTFFDGISRANVRVNNGCLRVDFGKCVNADCVMIEYLDFDKTDIFETRHQPVTSQGQVSEDLALWNDVYLDTMERVCDEKDFEVLIHGIHSIVKRDAVRKRVYYKVDSSFRYFRLPNPYEKIFKIAVIKNGEELDVEGAKATNLLPRLSETEISGYRVATVTLPESLKRDNMYLSVGINGVCGKEGVYVIGELDGEFITCPDRCPSFLANTWECGITGEGPFTYYLPVTKDMAQREIKLHILEMTEKAGLHVVDVHLCEYNDCREGITAEI